MKSRKASWKHTGKSLKAAVWSFVTQVMNTVAAGIGRKIISILVSWLGW